MKNVYRAALATAVLLLGLTVAGAAQAQKQGGILDLRRAIAMTIDHKAFIDILGEGQGDVGTAMLPGPEGLWAMPKEMMEKLPGYGPNVEQRREEARQIMQSLGYGPDKPLTVKISARNLPIYRDQAAILSDQLKQIWIDTEIELVETANWLASAQIHTVHSPGCAGSRLPGEGGCQEIGCIAAVRASRRTLRVLLSMREAFDGIKKIPHPEEAAKQLSRRTHGRDAANREFPYTLESRDPCVAWAPAFAGVVSGRDAHC